MNGTIRFQPRPEGGTVFTVEVVLPVADHRPAVAVEPGLVGASVVILCAVRTRAAVLREMIEALGARVTMLDGTVPYAAVAAALPRAVTVIDHRPPAIDAGALLAESGPATVVLGPKGWQSDTGDAIVVTHPAMVAPMREALLAARAWLAAPRPADCAAPLPSAAAEASMGR